MAAPSLRVQLGPEWRRFAEDLKSSRALLRQYMKEAAVSTAPSMMSAIKNKASGYSIRAGGAVSQQFRVAESVRMQATKRGASVVVGTPGRQGTGAFASGAEWGSGRFKQFLAPTRDGYFLWPGAKSTEPALLAAYEAAVERSMRQAFPN